MLHLKTGVHLHEGEGLVTVRVEVLDRAHAQVVHGACEVTSRPVHMLAHRLRDRGTGTLLEELLVATLHGALALAE